MSYLCWEQQQQDHVLANLDKLVVKAAMNLEVTVCWWVHTLLRNNGKNLLSGFRQSSQLYRPTLCLSRVPTLIDSHFQGLPCGSTAYILYGKDIT